MIAASAYSTAQLGLSYLRVFYTRAVTGLFGQLPFDDIAPPELFKALCESPRVGRRAEQARGLFDGVPPGLRYKDHGTFLTHDLDGEVIVVDLLNKGLK